MALFKRKDKSFYAFATGETIEMEKVPDEVFATKMMGEGIAILPVDGKITAPCAGKVSVVMDKSKHAVGIENTDGMEILIHVGLDTVNLMGEGFETHVEVGDVVEKGELLISFDKKALEEKGINLITMLVVVNDNGHTLKDYVHNQKVTAISSKIVSYK